MKLSIFNGSPRPGKNNTQLLLNSLIKGIESTGTAEPDVYKLNKLASHSEAAEIFKSADNVLIAFPLYSYAMPGEMQRFFEELKPLIGKCSGKKLGFLVQYGFREAVHARPLERHLEKLAGMLGCTYMGTIIKGGCDALIRGHVKPSAAVFKGIESIGKTLAEEGTFDREQLLEYSQPETAVKNSLWIMRIIVKLINRFYWGSLLKKNGVSIAESFAQPYRQG